MRSMTRSVLACALACMFVGSAALAEEEMPNFLKNAKVGDWVLYELMGGMQQKQTVTAVTKEAVTLLSETIMNGKSIASNSMDIPLEAETSEVEEVEPEEGSEQAPKPKITKGKTTVKGKEIECIIVTYDLGESGTSVSYFSKEVPIMGLVKTELGGNTTMKLVDFGKGE